jgi:hypothetical protein
MKIYIQKIIPRFLKGIACVLFMSACEPWRLPTKEFMTEVPVIEPVRTVNCAELMAAVPNPRDKIQLVVASYRMKAMTTVLDASGLIEKLEVGFGQGTRKDGKPNEMITHEYLTPGTYTITIRGFGACLDTTMSQHVTVSR